MNNVEIIGSSNATKDAVALVKQVAPTDLTVLITGETGTGKEVYANAVHQYGSRSKFPFISVNCGAIPETLLESELFGHEKGAFTGAIEQRKGFFEVAHRGTIFLDEIGEMPLGTQVKLLRVLESGEFSKIGSSENKRVDVRVVAATNRKLELEVEEKKFRRDLYFRLKGVEIHLLPLRERPEDIKSLVEYFSKKVCNKLGLKFQGISDEAMYIFNTLPWPGNVRELKNLIDTMLTLEKTAFIEVDILKKYIPRALPAPNLEPMQNNISIVPVQRNRQYDSVEFEIIFKSLLELKSDLADVKNKLYDISWDVQELKQELNDKAEIIPQAKIEDEITINFDNMNLIEVEKKVLQLALKRFDGNRRLAAAALGISERTLYRKLSDLGL